MDEAFGILTRQALELEVANSMYDTLYIVDFANVHKMNEIYGYTTVNAFFKNVFRKTKEEHGDNVIFGRVFSGDEIALMTYTEYEDKVFSTFKDNCLSLNIGFRYVVHPVSSIITLGHAKALIDNQSNRLLSSPNYFKLQ